jgi:hypothetical protein
MSQRTAVQSLRAVAVRRWQMSIFREPILSGTSAVGSRYRATAGKDTAI